MLLAELQDQLAAFYETPIDPKVADFLITDLASAGQCGGDGTAASEELLLVREDGDDVDVALYLDDAILATLDLHDPRAALHGDNLHAWLVALEGVSHFQYFAWNAGHGKAVTLFELELQAEVDKFVTTLMLMQRQDHEATPDQLHHRLFEAVSYRADLAPLALDRYRDANFYAAKYCRGLPAGLLDPRSERDCVNELRRFYRLTQNDKVRHIEGAGTSR